MKTITLILLITLLALSLAACNTTRGLGQDIQAVGASIERTANRHDDDSERDQ